MTEVDATTTTLRVHIVVDFTDEVRAGAEQGWGSQLDKLVEFLAASRDGGRSRDFVLMAYDLT